MTRSFRVLPASCARRTALALGVAALLGSGAALADTGKPIRLLVGFPAGGGSDAIARILADKLKAELGTAVIVENKPGAGGQIAAQALKAAPADGTTLFLSHDHTISILPLVVKTPGYNAQKDFVPVAGFATFVNGLAVSGATPVKNYKEFLQWVKTTGKGQSTVGIPAPASVPEFLVREIGRKNGLDLQAAPYRGSAPMMNDMLANQIPAGVGSVPDFIEYQRSGKVRVVAVIGNKRQAQLPDVPTFAELGLKGFEELPYYGIFAPAGTPKATLDTFSAALGKVIAQRDVNARLTAMGLTVGLVPGPQLAVREKAYSDVWAKIIRESGFQAQ